MSAMSDAVPLVISVPTAGALLGLSRVSAYRLAKQGGLPLAPLPGRQKVLVAGLEKLLDTRITAERIAEAAKQVAA